MEFSGPATCQEVSWRSGDAATSCVEVVKQHVCKSGFSKEVAKVVTLDLGRSTACNYFYQGKWFRFLRWCHGGNISPCKTTVPQIVEFSYLWRELKLSFPAVKG